MRKFPRFLSLLILLFHIAFFVGDRHHVAAGSSAQRWNSNLNHDSSRTTEEFEFPNSSPREPFRLGTGITDWDEQRAAWLEKHPSKRRTAQGRPRMILVTSSPPTECEHPTGDYFQLRSIKNKMDYCRLHMIQIYYNMAVMEMEGFWVKLPIIRRLMLQHPEAEWIWWMDSDAVFTDMVFQIPLERYGGVNMVIPGSDYAVYEDRQWTGLNAGIFLIRNCQWSLDFLDTWAALGEDYGNRKAELGEFMSRYLKGRPNFDIDDQAALAWLLISKPEIRSNVFLEDSYNLHSWWIGATARFDEMLEKYHPGVGGDKWPFITHFVGCKLCSGKYNSTPLETCEYEARRSFNLADDQVLQQYGYKHKSLTSEEVVRIPGKSTHRRQEPLISEVRTL